MSIEARITPFGLGPYAHFKHDELRQRIRVEPANFEALQEWFKRTEHVSQQSAREAMLNARS